MDVDQFISKYFDDAMNISALCSDMGFSNDDARLFIYIHTKSSTHPMGIQCFDEAKEEEIRALEIMLGVKNFPSAQSEKQSIDSTAAAFKEFGATMCKSVRDLDSIIRDRFGAESYLRSELVRRLRFHTDPQFRKQKLHVFSTTILPRMKEYEHGKAGKAFERNKKKNPVLILNFRDSLN
jgi:hypothetical protein